MTDIESSYKRAVIKNDGVESLMAVPSGAPSICPKEIENRNIVSINHTFQMES